MTKEICKNCKYWQPDFRTGLSGYCYRYPGGSSDGTYADVPHPRKHLADYCGEWSATEQPNQVCDYDRKHYEDEFIRQVRDIIDDVSTSADHGQNEREVIDEAAKHIIDLFGWNENPLVPMNYKLLANVGTFHSPQWKYICPDATKICEPSKYVGIHMWQCPHCYVFNSIHERTCYSCDKRREAITTETGWQYAQLDICGCPYLVWSKEENK